MPQLSLDLLAHHARQESPVAPDAHQRKLTKALLLPRLKALETDLLRLRAEFDQAFFKQPHPRQAEYPIGFCLEISKGVLGLLQREIAAPRTPGVTALRRFCQEGGLVKRVWGNLRQTFFQNAYQMGGLYVDVSNDTVTPTKPKVEILPLDKADFHPLEDFETYALLAERYWEARVYPNRYLPQLAPVFPLLLVYPSGAVLPHSSHQTMLYQNLLSDFALAERVLLHSPVTDRCLPEADLQRLEQRLAQLPSAGLDFHPGGVDDTVLRSGLREARDSRLRLDAARLQPLLNLAQAVGGKRG